LTRVLHVHSGNLYGGVETFLKTLARWRQLASSMEMTAAFCFDDRIAAELRREAIPTAILGAVRLRRPDSVWRAREELARVLRRDRVDVAVCHQAWPLAIFGSVIKAAGVRLVSWVHMVQTSRHWIDRLAERVEPDLIVCNSRCTASALPPTRTRVEIVYPPVTAAADVPATGAIGNVSANGNGTVRQELTTAADDVVITQVSRMENLKGQTVCLEALGQLRDQPGWTCWQIGGAQRPREHRYMESLRGTAADLGIAHRVRFTGSRDDVPALLAASDIFCQPNLGPEGFGITFIEAMAAGLPVVTSPIGGALEVVDDTCGVFVPCGDARALSKALRWLVTDAGVRHHLGEGGGRRARTLCDPAVQMRRIEGLLASQR
jgi:glycosyltransferase involved in cell wall biosynthesis